MATLNEELRQFLRNVERYLMQQEDLFGNVIYREEASASKKAGSEAVLAFPDER